MNDDTLKTLFHNFNRFMILLWRLGLGGAVNAWPKVGGRIMIITHTGRKSGLRRQTPANYTIVDGDIYCTAGFGARCDWYRNLKANPQVEVWLPNGWWRGVAEEVTDPEARPGLMRQVLIASGFASFAAGINPYTISDAQLAEVTCEYRLMRIRRIEARTGPGGPGDLAWFWPLAVLILLLRPRKKS